jgi:hypothetical protein
MNGESSVVRHSLRRRSADSGQTSTGELLFLENYRKGVEIMSMRCTPSVECDDVQDAEQLFQIVGLVCSLFFGIPLAIVLIKMISGIVDSVGRTSYIERGLQGDILWASILAVVTFVPIVITYVRYHRKVDLVQ